MVCYHQGFESILHFATSSSRKIRATLSEITHASDRSTEVIHHVSHIKNSICDRGGNFQVAATCGTACIWSCPKYLTHHSHNVSNDLKVPPMTYTDPDLIGLMFLRQKEISHLVYNGPKHPGPQEEGDISE